MNNSTYPCEDSTSGAYLTGTWLSLYTESISLLPAGCPGLLMWLLLHLYIEFLYAALDGQCLLRKPGWP